MPTLDMASAVSTMTSLTASERAQVTAALENSYFELSQMEETFNRNRYKRKWVQSTAESANLGQRTRIVVNLMDTASKSKIVHFEFVSIFFFQL